MSLSINQAETDGAASELQVGNGETEPPPLQSQPTVIFITIALAALSSHLFLLSFPPLSPV